MHHRKNLFLIFVDKCDNTDFLKHQWLCIFLTVNDVAVRKGNVYILVIV